MRNVYCIRLEGTQWFELPKCTLIHNASSGSFRSAAENARSALAPKKGNAVLHLSEQFAGTWIMRPSKSRPLRDCAQQMKLPWPPQKHFLLRATDPTVDYHPSKFHGRRGCNNIDAHAWRRPRKMYLPEFLNTWWADEPSHNLLLPSSTLPRFPICHLRLGPPSFRNWRRWSVICVWVGIYWIL